MVDLNDAISPPPAPGDAASQDDRNVAMLVHLSGIILGFIVALIVWLINKDRPGKGFLNDQAKEALNFQITILLAYIAGTVLTIILIGPLITFAAWIVCVIFSIVGGLKARDGVAYRYPFALRLVK
ncbi:MAG: DUF4870 domain-containing protein [Luteimonas sp.]